MERNTDVRHERFVANVRHERSLLMMGGVIAAAVMATLAVNAAGLAEVRAELRAISSKFDARVSTVMIEASEPVAYVTSQPDPLTIIVDLRNVSAGVLSQPIGPMPPVTGVEVEDITTPDGTALARVRVKMDRPAPHRVHSSRNVIYVDVERSTDRAAARNNSPASEGGKVSPTTAANRSTTATARSTTDKNQNSKSAAAGTGVSPAGARPARSLRGVKPIPNGVSIVGDGELIASTVETSKDLPPRVLLDFAGVSARNVPAVTEINQGDIRRVRVGVNSRTPLITRVVVDLAKEIAYRIERAGNELRVLFESTLRPIDPSTPPQAQGLPEQSRGTASAESPRAASRAQGGIAADARPEPPAAIAPAAPARPAIPADALVLDVRQTPAPPPPIVTEPAPPAQPAGQTRFTGPPVSLDFQGADLRAVLRTFAEISGLNIVIDPSINGTVDVSLRDVPWDQALDIILKANKLGYTVDGTVVRIAPLTVLAQENEEQRKLAEARALAGDLRVLTLPLSYARAPELVPILTRSALSSRGEVQVDTRTNTLIVRDLPDRLTTASELVKALDRPQPQVEIEARIVQTTRDFARSIGVTWGFNGRLDPALGNTTNLAFPNRGSVTGRSGGVQGPLQGDTRADTGVNLGVSGASSALGIALGSINGALNLDVVLSALERAGRGRLLSTPRVSTQNNVEAEMTQGIQIPIQTVANNTVTVSFKDAALTLRVTPQITASNTVIMRVFLENASPDFSRSVNNIPPIDTQRAITTVLVADGETTVIGGIYVSREQATEGRVPMLHRIPLLGWLFKRDELSDESRELLIFITPRITRS